MPICCVNIVRCKGLEALSSPSAGSCEDHAEFRSCSVSVVLKTTKDPDGSSRLVASQRTKPKFRTNSPEFRQSFSFALSERSKPHTFVQLSILEGHSGDPIGICSRRLPDSDKEWRGWLPLRAPHRSTASRLSGSTRSEAQRYARHMDEPVAAILVSIRVIPGTMELSDGGKVFDLRRTMPLPALEISPRYQSPRLSRTVSSSYTMNMSGRHLDADAPCTRSPGHTRSQPRRQRKNSASGTLCRSQAASSSSRRDSLHRVYEAMSTHSLSTVARLAVECLQLYGNYFLLSWCDRECYEALSLAPVLDERTGLPQRVLTWEDFKAFCIPRMGAIPDAEMRDISLVFVSSMKLTPQSRKLLDSAFRVLLSGASVATANSPSLIDPLEATFLGRCLDPAFPGSTIYKLRDRLRLTEDIRSTSGSRIAQCCVFFMPYVVRLHESRLRVALSQWLDFAEMSCGVDGSSSDLSGSQGGGLVRRMAVTLLRMELNHMLERSSGVIEKCHQKILNTDAGLDKVKGPEPCSLVEEREVSVKLIAEGDESSSRKEGSCQTDVQDWCMEAPSSPTGPPRETPPVSAELHAAASAACLADAEGDLSALRSMVLALIPLQERVEGSVADELAGLSAIMLKEVSTI
jgi:hypothetical protein